MPNDSRAPYIIICNGRIRLLAAGKDGKAVQQVVAASEAAATLVAHLATVYGDQLTQEDVQPISDLQHYMMDNLATMGPNVVKVKCAEMFALLDELEDKFE